MRPFLFEVDVRNRVTSSGGFHEETLTIGTPERGARLTVNSESLLNGLVLQRPGGTVGRRSKCQGGPRVRRLRQNESLSRKEE